MLWDLLFLFKRSAFEDGGNCMGHERGNILDKEFSDGVTHQAHNFQKEAQRDFLNAQKFVYQKNDDFEKMIQAHPVLFVVGAFIGGIALSIWLSRGKQ